MKKTYKDVVGTSFYNVTLESSVRDLINVLGEPYDNNTGDDKVNFEWEMETDNGDIFTVYDWKEYRILNKSEIITRMLSFLFFLNSMFHDFCLSYFSTRHLLA